MAKKILIVDDESHIRLLLERALRDLEDEGVEILKTSNGREALEIIKTEKLDLIYLDVMMPEMNGYEVCSAVKNEMGLRDVYIVLLTAKGQEMDKKKGAEVGADLYMTKPFDPDVVLEKAAEVLGIEI